LQTDGIGCSATSAVQLITSLDIDQKTVGVPVCLWPNPMDQELHIESVRPVNIALTAVDGKLLLRADQAMTINISHLLQGLYLVRISDAVTGALIKVDKINKK